jgi:tRNA(Ile)-lysidine synthase
MLQKKGCKNMPDGVEDAARVNWPESAARLATLLPKERLNPVAFFALVMWAGRKDMPFAVACSGGADSICLLLLVWMFFPDLRSKMRVLHFDHMIRGADSFEDARFVAEVARCLGVEFVAGSWTDTHPDASEEEAREARMAFLHANARVIAFGHNRTDVAETMLLRLGRGSSLDGLAGPRPVQIIEQPMLFIHIRPLLDLPGLKIREAMRASGIPWREDSTNSQDAYTRNRIRHEILPLLDKALGRDFAAGAARSRSRIDEADQAINSVAGKFIHEPESDLEVKPLHWQSLAIVRRAVELWLAEKGLRSGMSADALNDLVESIRSDSCNTPDLRRLGFEISDGMLRKFHPQPFPRYEKWESPCLVAGSEIFFPWGARLKAEALRLSPESVEAVVDEMRRAGNNLTACLSVPLGSVLEIRQRRIGDTYYPLGLHGKTTLKKALNGRKIPQLERDRIPIVLVGNRIAWCPMLPSAEDFKLTADSKEAIRLTYIPNQIF